VVRLISQNVVSLKSEIVVRLLVSLMSQFVVFYCHSLK
jgi:hypothetical protein